MTKPKKQTRRIISNSYLNDMSKKQREEYRNRRGNANIYSEKETDKIINTSKRSSNFVHMIRNAAGSDRSYIRNVRVNRFESKPVRVVKRVYDLIFDW